MWVCLFRFGINCMAVCALNIHIQNCQPPERSESNYQFFRDISPPPIVPLEWHRYRKT